MGGTESKPEVFYSVSFLLTKVVTVVAEKDRTASVKYLTMIETKFHNEFFLLRPTTEFCNSNGVAILIDIMREYLKDIEVIRICISIFDYQKKYGIFACKAIEAGGLVLFDKLKFTYLHDEYVGTTLPKLSEKVLELGSKSAILVIKNEATHLVLCECCQESVEWLNGETVDQTLLKHERVSKVLQYMLWYTELGEVQINCLDAIIVYSRNADSGNYYQDYGKKLVDTVGATLKRNSNKFSIMSRCLIVLTSVSRVSEICCDEVVSLKLHELSVAIFNEFETDNHLKQLIILFLDAVLTWPKGMNKIHTSESCMDVLRIFMNKLVNNFPILSNAAATTTAITQQKADNKSQIAVQRNNAQGYNAQGYNAQGLTTNSLESNYEIIIPLNITKFLLETKGVLLVISHAYDRFNIKVKKSKPRYGTSHEMLKEGQIGLNGGEDDNYEEEELNVTNAKTKIKPKFESKTTAGLNNRKLKK